MNQRNTRILIGRIALFLYSLGLSALYPLLPDRVPMKYGLNGAVLYAWPKALAILAILALNVFVFLYESWRAPKNAPLPTRVFIVLGITMVLGLVALIVPLVG